MKGARTPVGYTIVEVMIVLAVSGIMFLIAIDFIGGRQEDTSFRQGVNELASNLQNTVEQVNDGQYSDIDLSCNVVYSGTTTSVSAGINGQVTSTNSTSNDTQGQNSPCVFLGKVVQFNQIESGSGQSSNSEQNYETFSLAGSRLDSSGNPEQQDNNTTPLDNDGPTSVTGLTTTAVTPDSLNVIGMHLETTASAPSTYGGLFPVTALSTPNYFAVGFIQNLGTASDAGNQSGAQPIDVYYLPNLTLAANPTTAASAISGSDLKLVPGNQEIAMCVTDGTQYAYIEIGNTNNQLNVGVDMLDRSACS